MRPTESEWIDGAHHIGLTVPDVEAALHFFDESIGFKKVGEVPSYPAIYVSDGSIMITLWQAENGESAVPFDRRNNLGLHHLALKVRRGRLDDLHQRLSDRADVETEFPPALLGDGPTRHFMTLIPGGIRVEFIEVAS